MLPFEFLIPQRPVSHQAKSTEHKQQWRNLVYGRAFGKWTGLPVSRERLRFTLVYLCEADPPDINNLIKPVQDALSGLVYSDDCLIIDVQGHLRMVDELIDITGLPPLLKEAVFTGVDCLYIRVDPAPSLNAQL